MDKKTERQYSFAQIFVQKYQIRMAVAIFVDSVNFMLFFFQTLQSELNDSHSPYE